MNEIKYISSFFNIILIIFILRIVCQYFRINSYYPISQFLLKVTKWPIEILGKKSYKGFNLSCGAALLIFLFLKYLVIYALLASDMGSIFQNFESIFFYIILKPILLIIKLCGTILICLTLISCIISWFPKQNEYSLFFLEIMQPIYNFFNRFIPNFGPISVVPIVLTFGLYFLNDLIFEILIKILNNPGFAYYLWSTI